MAYNPYVAGSSGNTVEIPGDFPSSLIDDYYRAVVASRAPQQQYPNWWEGMGYGALQYANQYLTDWNTEDRKARELDLALEREAEKYRQQKAADLSYYTDTKNLDEERKTREYERQGQAAAALAPFMQTIPASEETIPATQPSPFNPYGIPQEEEINIKREMVNTPGEPGGAVEMISDDRTVNQVEPYVKRTPARKPDLADAYAQLAQQNPLLAGVYADSLGVQGRTNMLDPNARAARDALTYQRQSSANLADTRASDLQATQGSRITANEARASRNFNDAYRLWTMANSNEMRMEIVERFLAGEYGDPNSVEAQQFLAAAGLRPSYTPQQQTQGRIDAYQGSGLPVPGTQPRMQQGHGPRLSANDQMMFDKIKTDLQKQAPNMEEGELVALTVQKYLEWKQAQRSGSSNAAILEAIKRNQPGNVPPKTNPLIKK